MKIKDYSIIETEYLKEKINRITELDEANFGKWTECLIILKEIESKCKPLTPIVENAFDAGNDYGFDSANMDEGYSLNYKNQEEYINTIIIE